MHIDLILTPIQLNKTAAKDMNKEYSFEVRLVLFALGVLLTVLIIASNAFVLIVFAKERPLRKESNWFVVSLAIADFLVGLIIMPQTVTYKFLGYWPFGFLMCEVWLALDVLLCTASILLIVQIALDRFIALKFPLYYLSCKRSRFAISLIFGAWVIAFLIALPPLVGWRPVRKDGDCNLSDDLGYVLYSSFGSFFIPVLCLTVLYAIVLRITLRRARRLRRKVLNCREICKNVVKPLDCVVSPVKRGPSVTSENFDTESDTRQGVDFLTVDTSLTTSGTRRVSSMSQLERIAEADEERNGDAVVVEENRFQQALASMRNGSFLLETPKVSVVEAQGDQRLKEAVERGFTGIETRGRLKRFSVFEKRLRLLKEKERQSMTMLGTIIVTFIVCWLPFFLIYVLEAFGHKAPPLVFDAFFLLGYYNSAANPLIYGFLNAEFKAAFRKAFKKLDCDLTCVTHINDSSATPSVAV